MNFWQELRRRRVIRVAIVYAITAWLLVQITAIIFPIFDIPEWASRLVIILLTIGFPIALILTWGFELTPDGMQRRRQRSVSLQARKQTEWVLMTQSG